MKVRAHVFMSGMVQGVFFRWHTKREAERHGVKGRVRNLEDGRVEAVFEGEEEGVKRLVDFCKRGPRGARVDHVEVSWEPYTGGFTSFDMVY